MPRYVPAGGGGAGVNIDWCISVEADPLYKSIAKISTQCGRSEFIYIYFSD